MTAKIGTRAEIVQHYRGLHPADLDALKSWLVRQRLEASAAKIACYEQSDPETYIYGDRSAKGPFVLLAFGIGSRNRGKLRNCWTGSRTALR